MTQKPTQHVHGWQAAWKLIVEIALAVALFLFIAGVAVGLNLGVHYLRDMKVDGLLVFGLQHTEYGLFLLDLLLFGRMMWRAGLRTWKSM